MDPLFVQGILWFVGLLAFLFGTTYILMAMVLGWKMAYLVMGSVTFGIMVILAGMWFMNALGPKGPETTWHGIGVGSPDLAEVRGFGGPYNVSDYPEGEWEAPARGRTLADLPGRRTGWCLSLITSCAPDDTLRESENVRPVMDSLVGTAVSLTPGKRASVSEMAHGNIQLEPGKFEITDIRMKEATVDDKPSLIAVARAVPVEPLLSGSLGSGVEEGTLEELLVPTGQPISAGTPIMRLSTDRGPVDIVASRAGNFFPALRPGDSVRPNAPIGSVDVSGQPGTPAPAEVAAARVRGAVRVLPLQYLIVSIILFAIHMAALSRAERARRAVPQPA